MDYFTPAVIEFLRADRAVFINTEYCIQLKAGKHTAKGEHWYCDVVALDFGRRTVYLCEITYAVRCSALLKRLREWEEHWEDVCLAVKRDGVFKGTCLNEWQIKPWLFVPAKNREFLENKLSSIGAGKDRPEFECEITTLEEVLPWRFEGIRNLIMQSEADRGSPQ